MYHYRYATLRNHRQPYNNQFFTPPSHLQYQWPQLNQINGLGRPADWNGLVNPAGWWSPGHPVNWMAPLNQMGLNTHGQMMGWGGFGGPVGWGNYGNPMGWGNNMAKGQPGIFGGLLNVGKGALGGFGILSNLISLGKFLI